MSIQNYAVDADTVFHDGTAMTATGNNAGSLAFHDFGDAVVESGTLLVIDVRAVDFGDADETYIVVFEGSNDDFSTNIELQKIEIVTEGGIAGVGRWYLPIQNQIAGITFGQGRVAVTSAGTTLSITPFIFLSGPVG